MENKERTEIVDTFLDMLKEDLAQWDFCKRVDDKYGHLQIYQKLTKNGKPIRPSESYYRCSAVVKDTQPQELFELLSSTEKRLSWDNRMEHIEEVIVDGIAPNEIIWYFMVAKSNLPFTSQRDCLVKMQKKENYPEPGQYTYAQVHYKHDSYPPN